MKEYLLVFRNSARPQEKLSQEGMAKNMENWKNWIGSIAQEGKFIGGQPLSQEGRVLTQKGANITDAPFAEGKEVLNGYLIVTAADFDEAVNISKGCPIFEFDGSVEVREIDKIM